MGDSSGPDVAQLAHEAMLRKNGCLCPGEHLKYNTSVPSSNTWEGVYIDDRFVISVLPSAKATTISSDLRDCQLVTAGEKAYEETLGIERASEKEVRYATDFTAWGTQILGRKGRACAPRQKRSSICALLSITLRQGHIDRKSLERLLCQVIHPFMHRWEFLRVMHQCFHFVQSLSYGPPRKIPGPVLDELTFMMLLLPTAEANLRWAISDEVSAVDATPAMEGACVAPLPSKLAHQLFRIAEHKGAYVWMDWTAEEIDR